MKATDLSAGRYFISHSYQDSAARDRLLASLPAHVEPFVLAPITVEPHEFVSTPLIEALRGCDGVIMVNGQHSASSFWVAFEREIAVRSGLIVYQWDEATSTLELDTDGPTDLAVFVSYSPRDRSMVEQVLSHMHARSFDVWWDGDLEVGAELATAISRSIADRLRRGGYVILFVGPGAAARNQVWDDLKLLLSDASDRVVVAMLALEELPPSILPSDELRRTQFVSLCDEHGVISNRVDDLIVRLCWLMYRNRDLPA